MAVEEHGHQHEHGREHEDGDELMVRVRPADEEGGHAPSGCTHRAAAGARSSSRQTLIAPLRKSLFAIFTLMQDGFFAAKAASSAGPSSSIVSTQKPTPPHASTTFS